MTMTYSLCPNCGAQLTDPDKPCWNCTPAIAIEEINVPVINGFDDLPEDIRKRLEHDA
jgi:hypothetical protein